MVSEDEAPGEKTNTPVAWVHGLLKAELEAMLAGLNLDTTGSLDDLRKRFKNYLKSKGAPEQKDAEVIQPTALGNAQGETPHALPCERVRKWGLNFNGEGDALSFLERIEELQECYTISNGDMLTALPELFRGKALLWYRNSKQAWSVWKDFIDDFKLQYLPPPIRVRRR